MLKKKLGIHAIERDWDIGIKLRHYYKIPSILIIPDGCREIGNLAFYNEELEKVVIPGSVEKIGEFAFCGCENAEIKLMKLKKSRKIGPCAFKDCKKLIRE